MRIRDLAPDLRIEGSPMEERIDQVNRELERKGIVFKPYFWISDDWFTPDGLSGMAIPFYMVHPRLARLEQRQMLEVEGGAFNWSVRILRHETGHAIENAYGLRRLRRRQQLFGKSSERYPDYYSPRPYSRSFVLHLDSWYAQSHPDEDFAETFAVWLSPRSNWRKRYAGWPALKKLEYVDELMGRIAGRRPLVTTREFVDPASRMRKTLREHYTAKRKHYGIDYPDFFERDLRRLFSDAPEYRKAPSAARILRLNRKEIRRNVGRWTGTYQYTIDQVLQDMIDLASELGLRLTKTAEQTIMDFTVLLAVHTMNYLHSGRHRVAL